MGFSCSRAVFVCCAVSVHHVVAQSCLERRTVSMRIPQQIVEHMQLATMCPQVQCAKLIPALGSKLMAHSGILHVPQMTASDTAALLATTALMEGPSTAVHWFPEYGCAVLALQGDGGLEGPAGGPGIQLGIGTAELHTVCLDSWEHKLHR